MKVICLARYAVTLTGGKDKDGGEVDMPRGGMA